MNTHTNQTSTMNSRTSRMILNAFIVIGLIISIGNLPNTVYANTTENNYQPSPKIGTRDQTQIALANNTRSLWYLSDRHQQWTVGLKTTTLFAFEDMQENAVLWSWGWCTKNYQKLVQNWNNLSFRYVVNGKSVPLRNFTTRDEYRDMTIDGHGMQRAICRTTYGLLSNWPAGAHTLLIEGKFTKTINDGWDTFSRGTTYNSQYIVNVSRPTNPNTPGGQSLPIGIEHLGKINYTCYHIRGTNGYELSDQMDKLGPLNGEAIAMAEIKEFKVRGGTCYRNGKADMSDVTVGLVTNITVPCWYPPSNTSQIEIDKFDEFMKAVAKHELTHVKIDHQHAKMVEERLKTANTCDEKITEKIWKSVWDLAEIAHEKFHNSYAGRSIPYP